TVPVGRRPRAEALNYGLPRVAIALFPWAFYLPKRHRAASCLRLCAANSRMEPWPSATSRLAAQPQARPPVPFSPQASSPGSDPSVAVRKFPTLQPTRFEGISEPRPHWNLQFASTLPNPKFAWRIFQENANFGFGTLAA